MLLSSPSYNTHNHVSHDYWNVIISRIIDTIIFINTINIPFAYVKFDIMTQWQTKAHGRSLNIEFHQWRLLASDK